MSTRTAHPDQASDLLALDPLGPMGPERGSAELAGPLALDPLSPMGRDSTARTLGDCRCLQQQEERTS